MKAIALITQEHDTQAAQWQFDKVMSAIAYDLDLSIVFLNNGIEQLSSFKAWKCLDIYGIDSIYVVNDQEPEYLVRARSINTQQLNVLLQQSDLVL